MVARQIMPAPATCVRIDEIFFSLVARVMRGKKVREFALIAFGDSLL